MEPTRVKSTTHLATLLPHNDEKLSHMQLNDRVKEKPSYKISVPASQLTPTSNNYQLPKVADPWISSLLI